MSHRTKFGACARKNKGKSRSAFRAGMKKCLRSRKR